MEVVGGEREEERLERKEREREREGGKKKNPFLPFHFEEVCAAIF